jgi:hypothetical protein
MESTQTKIKNKEPGYIHAAEAVLALLMEGIQRYGDKNEYRFTLREIMRRVSTRVSPDVNFSEKKASIVLHFLFNMVGIKYDYSPGNRRRVYEVILDEGKIKKIEEYVHSN